MYIISVRAISDCVFLYQEGKSALLRAAETGNISAVKRELSGHTDVNCQDEVSHNPHILYYNGKCECCLL